MTQRMMYCTLVFANKIDSVFGMCYVIQEQLPSAALTLIDILMPIWTKPNHHVMKYIFRDTIE